MQTVANPEQCIVAVDLVNRCICPESGVLIPFAIEPLRRSALLEGRDHIANTLVHAEAIAAFEAQLEHRSGRGADASCPRRSG
jgi:3-isopropylmalate/(R)-2-methylmalate dehydratase small subunit